MSDFTVERFGTDTSGRPILMTHYMTDWWERVCAELGFTPTIVQGAFMARVGGGAAASAGYHDEGGCLDLRTWDRTGDQVARIIRTTRRLGAGSWVRDHRHGMDPHIHLVLGSDQPIASGAQVQWSQYLNGRDGLARNGPDYHWRPNPLVTTPPAPEEDDDMLTKNQHEALMEIRTISRRSANREMKMNGALRDVLAGLSDLKESTRDDATRKQARDLWRRLGQVLDELAEDEAADEESGEGDASPRS